MATLVISPLINPEPICQGPMPLKEEELYQREESKGLERIKKLCQTHLKIQENRQAISELTERIEFNQRDIKYFLSQESETQRKLIDGNAALSVEQGELERKSKAVELQQEKLSQVAKSISSYQDGIAGSVQASTMKQQSLRFMAEGIGSALEDMREICKDVQENQSTFAQQTNFIAHSQETAALSLKEAFSKQHKISDLASHISTGQADIRQNIGLTEQLKEGISYRVQDIQGAHHTIDQTLDQVSQKKTDLDHLASAIPIDQEAIREHLRLAEQTKEDIGHQVAVIHLDHSLIQDALNMAEHTKEAIHLQADAIRSEQKDIRDTLDRTDGIKEHIHQQAEHIQRNQDAIQQNLESAEQTKQGLYQQLGIAEESKEPEKSLLPPNAQQNMEESRRPISILQRAWSVAKGFLSPIIWAIAKVWALIMHTANWMVSRIKAAAFMPIKAAAFDSLVLSALYEGAALLTGHLIQMRRSIRL
ncbi:phage tail tape measure protein [Candidatus Protochlamydia phocaeensis]|uniref:phage tail tape measure protein n=1 Tax=Candidatus Protochlamydia phocaeensis TaxID=1414722 RepID=UPI000837EA7B|nr:phage tail tape measure protein [Candidatus Protochlamydia phocaeensis]